MSAPRLILGGTYNVRNYGAVSDGATNCQTAFETAAAKCTNRASTILVPNVADGAFPGYLVNGDFYHALGTVADGGPGCVTELRGRIITKDTLKLQPGHLVLGDRPTQLGSNDQMVGSMIRAASVAGGWVDDGRAIVQLGRLNVSANDGTRLENVFISGVDAYPGSTVSGRHTNIVGVYSNSAQERSGLLDCIVGFCTVGIKFEGAVSVSPSNWTIEHTDCWGCFTGMSLHVKGRVIKCTVANVASTLGTVAYALRGTDFSMQNCHAEGYPYALEIAGPGTGVGNDNDFWNFNFDINTFSAYNNTGSGQGPMIALVRIRNSKTHLFNVKIEHLSTGTNNTTNFVVDDFNGITVPTVGTSDLQCGEYSFGGVYGVDSANTQKRPVYCSRHQSKIAATMATTEAEFDPTFAETLRVTAAVGNSTIHGMKGGYLGRKIRVILDWNADPQRTLTFANNSATCPTASSRFETPGFAPVVLSQANDSAILEYGIGLSPDKWIVTKR